MKELQDRILKDGQVIGTNILKVNKIYQPSGRSGAYGAHR
mgnify:CR=1 FL=1